jgi:hypothetical protein
MVASMLKIIIRAAFFWSLTASAFAQSGAEITLSPNTRQDGLVPFANSCPTAQTYKVFAEPQEDWLRLEPSNVNVGPNSSFAVRVTANSTDRKLGTYRSTMMVVCSTCAATDPPCLQSARQFPVAMTVAHTTRVSSFTPMAPETPALPPPPPPAETTRVPLIAPPPAAPPTPNRMLLPYIALAMLVVGLLGAVVALRGLMIVRAPRIRSRHSSAESERHQVRR